MGLDHGIKVNDKYCIDWRKCYHFRDWFSRLKNFDDEGYTPLTVEILENFLADLKTIAANHSLAEEVMPIYCGSYDECSNYYFNNIEQAIVDIEDLLSNICENDEIKYWESY